VLKGETTTTTALIALELLNRQENSFASVYLKTPTSTQRMQSNTFCLLNLEFFVVVV
jgi:hypothetical protein